MSRITSGDFPDKYNSIHLLDISSGKGNQQNFSEIHYAAMHDKEGRETKVKKMVAVLQNFLNRNPDQLSLLDVSASTGITDNILADYM